MEVSAVKIFLCTTDSGFIFLRISLYLCQGNYVIIRFCLFVCLCVYKIIKRRILKDFSFLGGDLYSPIAFVCTVLY